MSSGTSNPFVGNGVHVVCFRNQTSSAEFVVPLFHVKLPYFFVRIAVCIYKG